MKKELGWGFSCILGFNEKETITNVSLWYHKKATLWYDSLFYRDSHSLPSLFTKSCVTIKTFYDSDSMYNLAIKCQSVIYAKYENMILGNI